jgi:cysteine desulfurase/selenocysteine lyase
LNEGDNVVISHIEHHSNIVPWQLAVERKGAELRVIPVADNGELELDTLNALIDNRTKVVAVTQASNTLGTRPDLATIIAKAHSVGAVVVVDGCQGVVHGGVDVKALDCDFYAFSGHKLYGPTGIGVLYGRKELLEAMPPFMGGGDMVDKVTFAKTTYAPLPLKYEAGTSNFIGAVGLGEAIEYVESIGMETIEVYEQELLEYMTEQLSTIEGLKIYGTAERKCPLVCFTIEGTHPYDVGMILDKLGVAIRTGHHCAEPVMTHFGVTGMCRASIGMYNTKEEVDALVKGVERAVMMLK